VRSADLIILRGVFLTKPSRAPKDETQLPREPNHEGEEREPCPCCMLLEDRPEGGGEGHLGKRRKKILGRSLENFLIDHRVEKVGFAQEEASDREKGERRHLGGSSELRFANRKGFSACSGDWC